MSQTSVTNISDDALLRVSDVHSFLQTVNQEIHAMKLQILDAVASMEQTKTLYNRSRDPLYKDLISSRPLDPRLSTLNQVTIISLQDVVFILEEVMYAAVNKLQCNRTSYGNVQFVNASY